MPKINTVVLKNISMFYLCFKDGNRVLGLVLVCKKKEEVGDGGIQIHLQKVGQQLFLLALRL